MDSRPLCKLTHCKGENIIELSLAKLSASAKLPRTSTNERVA